MGAVKTGGQRGFQQLIVHLANTGNVLRKPTGKAEVVKSGHLVQTLPFVMDTFLPQTAIDYPILLKKALLPGDYQARVTLTFPSATGTPKTVVSTRSFTVSKTDVKQVFTSAAPTQQPATGSTTSRVLLRQLAAVGLDRRRLVAAVLVLLLALQLRRRGAEAAAARLRADRRDAVAAAGDRRPPRVPGEPVENARHVGAAAAGRPGACRPALRLDAARVQVRPRVRRL